MNRIGDWQQTYCGIQFYPLDPRAEDICVQDIAHALGLICRFSGHIREFYSVAQHSVMVSHLLPRHLQLAGLLHDATEAYLADVPRPVKVALPDYKRIEHQLESVIAAKFGVDFSDPLIKQADNIALMTEARDLLGKTPAAWGVKEKPDPRPLHPQRPTEATLNFVIRFSELTQK